MSKMLVSVICTVFNEAHSIDRLLTSLNAQTILPNEVVIVDGGSSDGTPAKIRAFAVAHPHLNINLLVQPGYNISEGRNAAITVASHSIIAATDAGVRLPNDWLENLIAPFSQDLSGTNPFADDTFVDISLPGDNEAIIKRSQNLQAVQQSGKVHVVAGFFQTDPDPHSAFEIAMGATVLPAEADIKPEKFLPSSRSVAFSKEAWHLAGGYPEWLDYCEDLIFDLNLKKLGYVFYWQPKAIAYFKPRSSLRVFYRQYYHYARGDGKANLFLKRHILRYFIYLGFAPLGIALMVRWRWLALPFLMCAEAYVSKAHRRLLQHIPAFRQLPLLKKIQAILYVPLIRLTGDVAKMAGYPVGVLWQKKHRPK